MWSSLSSYTNVSGLKAAASKLKGQLSELTSEVMADLEESESQAKDNVEQYRQRKAAEQQQQLQHGQHAEDGEEQEHPAGHEHQQPNGYAATSSSGQNGAGFFDAAAHALQAQLEDDLAPAHSLPLSDGAGLGQSFPVTEMDDAQRAEQAAYEQHLQEQRMLQEQHMAAAHHQQKQQQQQLNGFGQAHDQTSLGDHSLQSHTLAPIDTLASPQYEGNSLSAPHSAHAFHEHTPVAQVHTLHQATHSPSQLHEHALEEHGGLSIEHHAPLESDSQSPLNLSHASRDHSHADEMDGVDLQQQQHEPMFDHAQQQQMRAQQQQQRQLQQLAHLQSLLQQSELDHAQQTQQAAARIQQLEAERQERDDHLAQMQSQAQESRARLSAELESKEQEYERLQSAYSQLMQRQEAAAAAAATAAATPAPVTTQPSSSAVDSESSLDVAALLGDSSVPADEKLSLLAEEIELLTARSRKWQTLAQTTAPASDAPSAVAAPPASPPAPAPAATESSASAEADAARIAALESQVEELQERLESVTDEKDTLTEILNELKAESNQATAAPAAAADAVAAARAEAAAESDARWSAQLVELQSQLRALTAEKERMSVDFEQSFQSHGAQVHHLEAQLAHAHEQISAAQTTAADQQQAMLETLQLQQQQAEEIQQLQQQILRANEEIAALNNQHEADQTALHQLHQQQQHDAALLAASASASASVPSSPSNRTLLPAFDISAPSSVANTPAGTGAQLLPPATPSPSLERQQELESLRAQLADLSKSNEKLRHFRGQAVAWKTAAEASMHKLLARKEQIQRELKLVTMERDALRQQQGLTIPATGGASEPSVASSSSSVEASSLPFAPDPARVAELQAHEHAAALALVQAQLDLARQQLAMQLDQIEALQGRIQELETQGRLAAHAQASSPAHTSSAEEEARIQHEYLQVTDALRSKLQAAEQALEVQRSQLGAAVAQEQQLHSIQQQYHELQSNYTALHEAYDGVCNRGRQDAAAAVELQAQLDTLRSKSEEDLSALQLQLDAARTGSSADVASLQSEWSARLAATEERFTAELQQAREERAKAESTWLEMLNTKQDEWNLEVEQEREAWKMTEQQWVAQQQAAAEQTAQQISDLQAELQASNDQIQSLQQQLQATASAVSTTAAAPSASPDSSARVSELEAQVAALTEKAAQTAGFTQQMVAQMNARYEQLLTSFTNLQARCRDGLEGEEGNLAQIAELRAALAAQQKAAAEVQSDLQTQLDTARAESRKAAAGSGELGIMTMRWREAMSEADSLRKKIRSLQEDRGEPASGGASDAPPSAELQDELQALRHQVKNLQLDAASMESLQSDYSALQRTADMTASMLAEARTTIDELRRALDDAQRAEHAAQSELASMRNASADSLAVQASSNLDSTSSQVAELQSALSRKSDQLSEMASYTSSLEAEILSLRKTFESKLKNFNALADEHLVDRRLVVKMLVTYFERPNKDEVLSLMGRVLQFTAEDNARIQKGRQGYMGLLGSFLRSPGGTAEEESAPFHSEADANLADNFFNFLMQETEKEAAAAAAAAGGGKTTVSASAPPPLTTSSAARAALDHQRQSASFSRESEFESRPTRSFAEQQQHMLPQPTFTPQQPPPPQQQPPQPQHPQAPPQWSSPPALVPSPLPPPPMAGSVGAPLAPPSFAPLALPPFSAAPPPFPSSSGAPAGFPSLPPLPFAVPPHAMAPFPGAADGSSGFLMPPQPLGPLPPMPVNGFQLPPPLHAPR